MLISRLVKSLLGHVTWDLMLIVIVVSFSKLICG